MSVIGIDFGNSECVIAQAKRGGIDVILNENSNRKNPNVVSFQGKQRFMGEAAASIARSNWKNTAVEIKRLIGRRFKEPEVQAEIQRLPFKCVELPSGFVGVEVMYNDKPTVFSCEKVVAMMLFKLRQIAEAANPGLPAAYTVLAVPTWWTDTQRRFMLSAAEIAGVNVLRLMNESTATALSYGIYKSARNLFHATEPQYVMFIDLGHSGYTVSVVAFVQGKLEVKGVAYDRNLGGRDFDYALYKMLAEQFKAKTKLDVTSDKRATLKLMAAAEKTKKSLSPLGVTMSHVSVECLKEERDFETNVQLADFEEIIKPLVDRLEGPVVSALKEAGIEAKQLANVEIVGGGTRVPAVKVKLAQILGLDTNQQNFGLSTTLNADESVARGCALECAILSPLFKVKEFNIVDRLQYPVKVFWDQVASSLPPPPPPTATSPMETEEGEEEGMEGVNEYNIFERGDDYPKVRRITFRRKEDFEVSASYAPEAAAMLPPSSDLAIGKFKIKGVGEKSAEEAASVRVNVKEDIHGIFSVSSAHLMQPAPEEPAPAEAEKKPEEEKEGGEKMETEKAPAAEGEKAPAAAAGGKKRKFKKIELQVESYTAGLTRAEMIDAIEEEAQMALQDRLIEETADMRNALETYIYDMRNQISDKLRDYCLEKDRMTFNDRLQDMENWLYSDEGFSGAKHTFREKLDELKKIGDPIEMRYREQSERQVAANELKTAIEECENFVRANAGGGEGGNFSHITEEEWNKVRGECSQARTWLYDQMDKQSSRQMHENPVLTSSMIREKRSQLENACRPVLTKPKPKEEKPAATGEKEKTEEQPQQQAEAGQAGKEEKKGQGDVDADFFMSDAEGPKPPAKTDDEMAEDVNGEKMEVE